MGKTEERAELKKKIISLMEEIDEHINMVAKLRGEIKELNDKSESIKVESIMETNKYLIGKCYHQQSRVHNWTYDKFFKFNGLIPDIDNGTVKVVVDRIEVVREDDILTKHIYIPKSIKNIDETWNGSIQFIPKEAIEITEEEFNRQLVNFK